MHGPLNVKIGYHFFVSKCVFGEVEIARYRAQFDYGTKKAFRALWEAGAGCGLIFKTPPAVRANCIYKHYGSMEYSPFRFLW
jgi:hypothetical protein